MADLLDFGGVRVLDMNAAPGAGYVARFYQSGTTNPVVVYTDSGLGTPHGTSVTADAAGVFAAVWSSGGAVKCVIETDAGAVVQTIDPVISVSGSASGAEDITFTPTVDLPFTNVQDAIEGAAASAASGFTPYGLGITGNATLLANLDATNIGSGAYRFDGTTTGTYPTGVAAADTGLIEHWRQSAATAMQVLYHATSDRVFHRRMASSAWGAWRENIEVNQGAAEGDTIYRGASAWTRLAKGTAGQLLRMNSGATAPEWSAGPIKAWANFDGRQVAGTYTRTGTLVTVTQTSHGLSTGMSVTIDFTSGTATDGTYTITVSDANTYTVTDAASGATSGNLNRNMAIKASVNVTSIVRNSAGNYTVTFASAISDTGYAVTINGELASLSANTPDYATYTGKTTTTVGLRTGARDAGISSPVDFNETSFTVVR